ncbi:MAG: acyltransferase [Chitinophagaceae bacterium]|jgi:peptidoglycan/LPS O-acetylase OafA/YrhL
MNKDNRNQPEAASETNGKNPQLEALRGIMAVMVLISHVSLIRLYFGRSEDYLNPVMYHLGRVAVTGFFVLSGYLITKSILSKIQAGEWNLTTFYRARLLRIAPLYFLIVGLAVFILPHIDALQFTVPHYAKDVRTETHNYWYFLFLLPEIPIINDSILPFAEPTWSIGVEEIFYILIPVVITLSGKRFIQVLSFCILVFLACKYLSIYHYQFPSHNLSAKILTFFRYDCIGLGCLLAVLEFRKSKLFSSVNLAAFLIAVVVLIALLSTSGIKDYDYFPYAVCFGIIITYLAGDKAKFNNPKWLVYTGTISYSLYLCHEIIVVFLLNLNLDEKSMPAMYLLSILFSVGLASLLYALVERPFMLLAKSKLNRKTEVSE